MRPSPRTDRAAPRKAGLFLKEDGKPALICKRRDGPGQPGMFLTDPGSHHLRKSAGKCRQNGQKTMGLLTRVTRAAPGISARVIPGITGCEMSSSACPRSCGAGQRQRCRERRQAEKHTGSLCTPGCLAQKGRHGTFHAAPSAGGLREPGEDCCICGDTRL